MGCLWRGLLHLLMWHLPEAEWHLGSGVLHPRTNATSLPFIKMLGLVCTLSLNTICLSLLFYISPGPDLYQPP